jgi:hypothetical protein
VDQEISQGGNLAGKLCLSDPEQISERNNQKRLSCPTRENNHDDTEKMLDPPIRASNNTTVFNFVRSLAKWNCPKRAGSRKLVEQTISVPRDPFVPDILSPNDINKMSLVSYACRD